MLDIREGYRVIIIDVFGMDVRKLNLYLKFYALRLYNKVSLLLRCHKHPDIYLNNLDTIFHIKTEAFRLL